MAKSKPAEGHDVIVIGASAGGINALHVLFAALPVDLPAAVFVVLHAGIQSHFAGILGKHASLSVITASDGARIEPQTIYVAPPGKHLLLHDGHMLLRRGPRENLSRPAIDPLFRTAAATFGGRVIGVVLSGALNDGTAGLGAIKRCGGLAVVQNPADADVPDMPSNALRRVDIDHVAPISDMGPLLSRLAAERPGHTPEIPLDIRLESAIAALELTDMKTEDSLGTLSPFTCPECHGALWEIPDDSMLRYRCHVGHAFTAESIFSALGSEVDNMMEVLLRSHQQRAALAHRMAERERGRNRMSLAAHLEKRAQECEEDAELMRRLVQYQREHSRVAAEETEGGALTNGEEQE
jgi:two-component system chemotaxis response regulator CheB